MSIFGRITRGIFGGHKKEEAKAAPAPAKPAPAAPVAVAPKPLTEAELDAKLAALPGADKFNWNSSIVDLMKLVGLDASYEERKELAHEMGRADYSGSAEDNIWLHGVVMKELAKNGGKVPASLAD